MRRHATRHTPGTANRHGFRHTPKNPRHIGRHAGGTKTTGVPARSVTPERVTERATPHRQNQIRTNNRPESEPAKGEAAA